MSKWIERRKLIVSKIRATFLKAAEHNYDIDEDALINEVCLEYGCSRRTAKEYIKSAKLKRRRYIK